MRVYSGNMRLLEDLNAIARIDRSDMLGRVSALPGECLEGWRLGLDWREAARWKDCRQMVVLGVGGSAIGGDLLQGILREGFPRPVLVNRTYTVPSWIGRQTFTLVCSYSGNTEETLSAAEQARRRKSRIAAITSGGKLAQWARGRGLPVLQIPAGLPPRSTLGYMALAPLGLLVRLGWANRAGLPVEQACRALDRYVRSRLHPSVRFAANPAKRLAQELVGRLPVLYGASGGWEGVTYRWRTQIEENSKTLTFHHLFPEATHNEISAWKEPRGLMKRMTAIFLTDPEIHPRTLRRMEFTRRIIRRQGARVLGVSASGKTHLERLLKLIALGDFCSVYLGLLYRMDPTPVERVEALKRYLKKGRP